VPDHVWKHNYARRLSGRQMGAGLTKKNKKSNSISESVEGLKKSPINAVVKKEVVRTGREISGD